MARDFGIVVFVTRMVFRGGRVVVVERAGRVVVGATFDAGTGADTAVTDDGTGTTTTGSTDGTAGPAGVGGVRST